MEIKANYIKARNKASEILILQESIDFPIDIYNILIPNKKIIFSTYQKYADKVGVTIDEISCNGEFNDAMVIKQKDTYLILYNDDLKNKGRVLWSLAHELGHIVLDHKNQGEKEEVEAHTFASQLLLPQCLLKKLFKAGIKITIPYLKNKFGLSEKASMSCLKLVGNKLENEYDAEYDDIILNKCSKFIKKELSGLRDNCYDEDMDNTRNEWLYDI